jgi:hypothetical protein
MALCGDSSLRRRQLRLHSRTKEMRLQAISAVQLLNAEFQQRTPTPTLQVVRWAEVYKGYGFLSYVHLRIRRRLNINKWTSNFK